MKRPSPGRSLGRSANPWHPRRQPGPTGEDRGDDPGGFPLSEVGLLRPVDPKAGGIDQIQSPGEEIPVPSKEGRFQILPDIGEKAARPGEMGQGEGGPFRIEPEAAVLPQFFEDWGKVLFLPQTPEHQSPPPRLSLPGPQGPVGWRPPASGGSY